MSNCTTASTGPRIVMGLDLGNKTSKWSSSTRGGKFLDRGEIKMTQNGVRKFFKEQKRCRVLMETGTCSPWVSRIAEAEGHEAIVANSRRLKVISENVRKSDELDAETLAELATNLKLIKQVKHRSAETQRHLSVLRSRDTLVACRTKLVNHVRSMVRSWGEKLPGSSTSAFARKMAEKIPDELKAALGPVIETIRHLGVQIREADRSIRFLCRKKYPQTESLTQVSGVGEVTALAYVLILEDPTRFRTSRSVGSYVGLTPRKSQSGKWDPQLSITKCGDRFLRRLLVGSAQYIMGPFGPDCDLRSYGQRICSRGGKNAKRRAVVAVARKLSVLLHRLWVTGAEYEPLRGAKRHRRKRMSTGKGQTPKALQDTKI
jgi:transposase